MPGRRGRRMVDHHRHADRDPRHVVVHHAVGRHRHLRHDPARHFGRLHPAPAGQVPVHHAGRGRPEYPGHRDLRRGRRGGHHQLFAPAVVAAQALARCDGGCADGFHGRLAQQGVAVERGRRNLHRQPRQDHAARREQRRARPFRGPHAAGCTARGGHRTLHRGIPGDLLHRTRGAHRRQKTGGIAMRRFGLIGRPLGHSASAAYFAAKFEREGIADCTYTLYELPEIGALERLLAETPDLCGFNVTIPYKREVMALLDDLSHDARLVGAVNCVRRTADSRLVGHNTDVIGLRAAFDCLLGGEQPSHALVLGTGGASQAVQYVLAERGIPFDLVSRDAAKGNYTYDNLPCEAVEQSRLIVNASPVGTYPAVDAAPRIPYGYLAPGHYLLDLVYNPPLTRFLDLGRQRGARILNGEVMFRRQAEASWRIWNE